MKRILADILVFLAILYTPIWVTAIFAISCLFYFENYYEIFVAGFILDLLYGAVGTRHVLYFHFIMATLFYLFSFLLKKKLFAYTRKN